MPPSPFRSHRRSDTNYDGTAGGGAVVAVPPATHRIIIDLSHDDSDDDEDTSNYMDAVQNLDPVIVQIHDSPVPQPQRPILSMAVDLSLLHNNNINGNINSNRSPVSNAPISTTATSAVAQLEHANEQNRRRRNRRHQEPGCRNSHNHSHIQEQQHRTVATSSLRNINHVVHNNADYAQSDVANHSTAVGRSHSASNDNLSGSHNRRRGTNNIRSQHRNHSDVRQARLQQDEQQRSPSTHHPTAGTIRVNDRNVAMRAYNTTGERPTTTRRSDEYRLIQMQQRMLLAMASAQYSLSNIHGNQREQHHRGDNIDVGNLSYEELLNMFGNGDDNRGASVIDISLLPVEPVTFEDIATFSSTSEQNNSHGSSTKYSCSVCLENYQMGERKKTLPCFHSFHDDCIDQWLHRNGSCPICKHRVGEN